MYTVKEFPLPKFNDAIYPTAQIQLPAEVITVFTDPDGVDRVRCMINHSHDQPLLDRVLTKVKTDQDMYTLPGYYIGTIGDYHYFCHGMTADQVSGGNNAG